MATLSTEITKRGNLMDVVKMKAPDGSPIRDIVNTLIENDEFTARSPSVPANGGLTHTGLKLSTKRSPQSKKDTFSKSPNQSWQNRVYELLPDKPVE